MRRIIKHLLSIIIALIIVLLLQALVISGAVVPNSQMTPTLQKDDRVIVNKAKVLINQLDTGDVIVYRQDGKLKMSRVIGKPGESVVYEKGQLYIDDKQVDEPYIDHNNIQSLALRDLSGSEGDIVPPNAYFVLNDDRSRKADSRSYGFIQRKDIVGSVTLRYYPFEQFKFDFNR